MCFIRNNIAFDVYRLPSGDSAKAIDIILEKVRVAYSNPKNEILIVGDLNWDCLEESRPIRKHIDYLCDEIDLQQIIKSATRISYGKS